MCKNSALTNVDKIVTMCYYLSDYINFDQNLYNYMEVLKYVSKFQLYPGSLT